MSTTIDEKVVEMRFDNKHFETNVRQTMSTLEKFKQRLNLTGASKGLEEIQKTSTNTEKTFKELEFNACQAGFSLRDVWLKTSQVFEYQIARNIINAARNMVRALTIDPISDGWNEYELTLNTIQTIMNSTGKSADEVKNKLKTLDEYADKTVYSTADMFNNIYKFTNAGIDLDTATKAMIGIANATADAGQGAQQASMAYYNLAQSLSSGYLTTMDYRSLNLANIMTNDLKQSLVDTAIKAGTVKKAGNDLYKVGKKTYNLQQLFSDALSEQWATSDVMMKVFGEYADETTEIGKRAYAAATEIRTFSGMLESLKAQAGTNWKETWELIFGDLADAKKFWTGLTNTISNVINAVDDFRNNLLRGALGKGFSEISKTIKSISEPIKTTVDAVKKTTLSLEELNKMANRVIKGEFGNGKKRLDELTKAGYNYYAIQNKVNEKLGSSFRYSKDLTEAQVELKETQEKVNKTNGEYIEQLLMLSDNELKEIVKPEQIEALKELQKYADMTGLSVKEFVDNIDEIDGRWLLFNSFKNAGQGLAKVFTVIKEAWAETIGVFTSDHLFNIIASIHKFSTYLKMSDETAAKLKSTFKGVFAVLDMGFGIISDVVGLFWRLLKCFKDLPGAVLDLTGEFGDYLVKLRDMVEETDVFGAAILCLGTYLETAINKLTEFASPTLSGIVNIAKNLWNFLTKIGTRIGTFLAESFRKGDIVEVVRILNETIFTGILLNLNNFIKNFSDSFENINDILDSFKGILVSYQHDIQAKTLQKIAIAIGILAASLLILSSINPDRLGTSMVAMMSLFLMIRTAFIQFGKLAPDVKGVFKATVALSALATSMLWLSLAFKILSTIEPGQMLVAMGGIIVGLQALIKSIKKLPENDLRKSAKAIGKLSTSLIIFALALKIMSTIGWKEMLLSLGVISISLQALVKTINRLPENTQVKVAGLMGFATSLVIFATALKIMSSIRWQEMLVSLGAMVVSLTALTIAIRQLPDNTKAKVAGLIGFSTAIVILASALKIMSDIHWSDMITALIGLAGGLTAIVLAVKNLPKNITGSSFGILLLSFSLLTLAESLKMLASLNMEQMEIALKGLGISLLMLVAASQAMRGAFWSSQALNGLLGGLILFAISMKMLGNMSWDSVIRSLVTLGVSIAMLGIAAKVLAPTQKAMDGLAITLLLFGLSAVAIGGGLILIATGISALALAVGAGATSIVIGITTIVLGIVGLIPEIIKIIGDSIILICGVLVEAAPTIADTVLIVLLRILEALAKYTPMIVKALADTIINTILALKEFVPAIVVAAIELIGVVLEAIASALKGVNISHIMTGILSLTILSALVYMLAGLAPLLPVATKGVLVLGAIIAELTLLLAAIGGIAQIPGLSWIVEQGGNFLQKIGTAIGQFIGGIIGGIALGATATLPAVGLSLSQFMVNLQPFISGVKNVELNMLGKIAILAGAIMALSTANLLTSIASFISFGPSLSNLGTELSKFMNNVSGFIDGAATIDPKMLVGVKTLSETILILTAAKVLEGLTSWFSGGNSLADFGSQLGGLGTNLNEFATNLGTFTDAQRTTIDCACNAIKSLALAASEIPNEGGFWGSIVGENSLSTFGSYLPGLGTHLNQFVTNLGTFTEAQASTTECAANAIKSLADAAGEIPNEGGFWAALVGDNSLAAFGTELPMLGQNLNEFVTNLGTFTDSQVSVADCAGRAIKALADAASEIPNEGGLWAGIVGDNSLASFGAQLPGLATNLNTFVTNLGTFDEAKISTVDCVGRAIKTLAESADAIPNEGGLWGAIVGDNSLATFAGHLPGLGTNLKNFVTNLGTFTEAQVTTVNSACKVMTSVAQLGHIDLDDTGSNLKDFGKDLVKFAKKVKEFVEKIGEVSGDSIESAMTKTQDLIEMAQTVASVNVDSLKTFGKSLKSVATEGVQGFVEEFSGKAPKSEAKIAVTDLMNAGISGAEDRQSYMEDRFGAIAKASIDATCTAVIIKKAEQAGKDLVTGFANGIKDNKYLATNAGESVGKSALTAVKEAIDSNSPSKEAYKLGNFFGEGYVLGIRQYADTAYSESYSMADRAKSGLSRAISQITDMVNTDIDAQPVIRPVLDLSDVQSGVGTLNGMFSNGPSLGVMANLKAISSGMSVKNQNGTNNDVVSAINKLGKSLGNGSGNTYNINGVTYDDGSNISEAVEAIIRAAQIGRRV